MTLSDNSKTGRLIIVGCCSATTIAKVLSIFSLVSSGKFRHVVLRLLMTFSQPNSASQALS